MAAIAKTCLILHNMNNEILVKINNNVLAKEMIKQAPKEVAHRIDIYFVKNNITIIKLCMAQTLPSGNIAI